VLVVRFFEADFTTEIVRNAAWLQANKEQSLSVVPASFVTVQGKCPGLSHVVTDLHYFLIIYCFTQCFLIISFSSELGNNAFQ
jgi:hypothetical protein